MRRARWSLLALAVLLLFACAPVEEQGEAEEQSVPAGTPSTAADEEAIREANADWDAAFNAADAATLASLYTADAVRMGPGSPTVHGQKAIQADFERGFAENPVQTTSTVEDLQVSGDWAFVRGTYIDTAPTAEGDETVAESGKWLAVMQRQPDGSWRFATDIWNSDLPTE